MSNYIKSTKNPLTGEWDDEAQWLDDYYGRHQYGVQFSNGLVVNPKDLKEELETREVKQPNTMSWEGKFNETLGFQIRGGHWRVTQEEVKDFIRTVAIPESQSDLIDQVIERVYSLGNTDFISVNHSDKYIHMSKLVDYLQGLKE